MTNDLPASDHGYRSGCGTPILIVLVLLVAVGVGGWYYRLKVVSARAAEVSIQEYLKLKSDGYIGKVELEGDNLFADMVSGGYVCGGRAYKHIHAVVPPAYLVDPKGLAELRSGLSPSQFTVTPR